MLKVKRFLLQYITNNKYVFGFFEGLYLGKSELTQSRERKVQDVGPDSFNLGLNISSSSTNVKSYWPSPSPFKSSISKGSGNVKKLPREQKRYNFSTQSLNREKKMKNTIPDLTMIKWSWLGMSVLNCWFRYWIVEMEDGRLRL